jgi:hypothetical protein
MITEPSTNPEKIYERAQEIYEGKVSPEGKVEKELKKEEKNLKEEIIEQTKTSVPTTKGDDVSDTVSNLLTLDDRAQLSELVKLVYTKDISFALKVARDLKNPLVLDSFHDLLASDKLYYKLLEQKKL